MFILLSTNKEQENETTTEQPTSSTENAEEPKLKIEFPDRVKETAGLSEMLEKAVVLASVLCSPSASGRRAKWTSSWRA